VKRGKVDGMTREVVLYTDGAAEGNPGPAGASYVILDVDGRELERGLKYLGYRTSNVAEYEALILGLTAVQKLAATKVTVRLDSELVAKQMCGEYKVKSKDLLPLYQQARTLADSFPEIHFEYIGRARNRTADSLAFMAARGAAHRVDEQIGGIRPPTVGPFKGCSSEVLLRVLLVATDSEPAVRLEIVSNDTGHVQTSIELPVTQLSALLAALEQVQRQL
jgi:ribonuclease HI